MTTRSFVWLTLGGGVWSLGSNWDDVTDGTSPSLVAPGTQDSVTVAGPSGAQVQAITGNGAVAAALFTGNTMLSGGFSLGALSVGGASGGLLELGRATSVQASSVAIASGSLVSGPASTLTVSGTLALGSLGGAAAFDVTGGGAAAVLALVMGSSADSIYVDPASILEVGSAGTGQAGSLTVDAGASLSGEGDANAYGLVTNNGTIVASGGTLSVGALGGIGSLQIGTGATLALNGACGAGQSVAFAGANATLAIDEEFFAPAGTVSGFVAGDAFDIRGSLISAASYAGGVLTLSYGGQVAAQILLAGNYAGSVFLTAGDGAGGTLVSVAPAAGGGSHPSPGTTAPDQYLWTAAGSGSWNSAANWEDLTTGASPARVAPGAANLVSIVAGQSVFAVISGPANAASLALQGEVALSGAYAIGTLTVGQAAGANFTAGTLDLLAGAAIAAGSAWVADGAISVSGNGGSLSVAGTLTLGGGPAGIGLPTASLDVTEGGSVQAACLVMGGGSGASLATDPTGRVEIGTAGGAQAGAVTIDAGAMLAGNGQVDPFGTIIDNGTILASGGTLTLGSVGGIGTLAVAAGATLELYAATADAIVLDGSAGTGASTLAFANVRAAPTGTITGLVTGDIIHLEGSVLTGTQYTALTSGGSLALWSGTTIVGRLALAGSMAGERFVLTPDGSGGTDITLVATTGGGGGTGQTGTDQLAWTSPVSGNWSRAGNWTDVTTGKTATLPPGAQSPVQIAGPGGTAFQSIAGTGICASLSLTGNTILAGSFTTGVLVIGQAGSLTEGTLDLGSFGTLTATQGVLADGALLCIGTGAVLSVAGTLALGGGPAGTGLPDTVLMAGSHGLVQLGGLSLGGGDSDTVAVDSTATLEVGLAGGAAVGALSVDAGALASGNGALNTAGPVIDNGAIDAQGGTLFVGSVSGAGTLGIGTEATLALSGTDSCPVAFLGGGATLLLPASALAPSGVIDGFVAGDSIIASSPLDAVSFQTGAGGIGTLTLWEAGQATGTLLLAGNFAGESFSVQPSGTGAAIILSAPVASGPPAGTATPDAYSWTGAAGGLAWANPGNWTDTSQGAGPAAAAPGQNDSVAIQGGSGAVLAVAGPADASSLSVAGTVSLGGAYAIGTLSVGSTQATGLLALGSGATCSAAAAQVTGGLAVGGGALPVAGTLVLGAVGVLAVSNRGAVRLGSALLDGAGSQLATDSTSFIEIGGAAGAALGSITIDAGGELQGAGAAGLTGQVIDQGTIVASGGTLLLGNVSGSGTLLAGVGADLVVQGSIGAGLTADFAGGGTLSLAGAPGAALSIADFGTGDTILLSVSGAGSADYAETGAGIGVLSVLSAGGQVLETLTLLGSQAGRAFSVAAAAGGGTVLTTQPDASAGQGGGSMTYPNLATGQISRGDLLSDVALGFGYVSQDDFGNLIGSSGIYLDYSLDGLAPAQTVFGGAGEPAGVNVEIVAPLIQTGGGGGPGIAMAMQAGYSAVLLEGNENIQLTDAPLDTDPASPYYNQYVGLGHALLVGNYGSDIIAALGDGDTMVGAPGANTVFYAALRNANAGTSLPIDVHVHGGGNDTIATTNDNAAITTSGGSSAVFLGGSDNAVVSYGSDTIGCSGLGNDTIYAQTGAGRAGDVVFSGTQGLLNFIGGNAPSTVVGCGGQVEMQGGNGSGSLLWAGSSDADYYGGAGSALIVGGSGHTHVQGGSGPVTVFGGTGDGVFSGSAGSAFVVGTGNSTVNAVAGNTVWVLGSAQVSVSGSNGVNVYGGSAIGNDIYQANAGNETLWGGAGNDQFTAGTGNDIFVSGGGRDVFNYSNGVADGIDTIVGFVPGQSTIALHGFGSQTPQISVAWGDSFINLPNGGQIIVENVTNLTGANFTFS